MHDFSFKIVIANATIKVNWIMKVSGKDYKSVS